MPQHENDFMSRAFEDKFKWQLHDFVSGEKISHTAGAASSAPSAVEKVTCLNPFSFINLGPSCTENSILKSFHAAPSKISNC